MQYATIHDLVYAAMKEICYDREYLYVKFADTFGEIMRDLLHNGYTSAKKNYIVNGLKSGKRAEFDFLLLKRPDFFGCNEVEAVVRIYSSKGAESYFCGYYELSLGERVPERQPREERGNHAILKEEKKYEGEL